MKKLKRYAVLGALLTLVLALSACSPQTDKTDPLSDYSVDINVPFPTSSASYTTVAPEKPQYTISTQEPVKIVGWMNETMDAREQDSYTHLSVGSIGTAVKNLQKRLIELGYMSGTASGTYDQATAQAVRLFEAAYGQKQTGIASPLMQVYLFSTNAKNYTGTVISPTQTVFTDGYTQLERGNTGSAVVRLQNRLIELGYLSGSASGIFDTNTENAVKEFEAAYGKQRTGIATVSLQTYLFSSGAYRAGDSTPTPGPVTPTPKPVETELYTTLQYGSRGTAVRKLQQRLKELGYYTGKIDNIYGTGTVNAVKRFESAYNQPQTGIATAAMQKILFSNSAMPYTEPVSTPTPTPTMVIYRTLSIGSYGNEVTRLQNRLKQLGYLNGKVDGYYGDDTAKAVRAFEARYGRAQTGIATAAMQQYLFAPDALSSTSKDDTISEYITLSQGSYGSDVYSLQQRLIQLKYMAGSPDGYYGSATVQAVKAFERAHGRSETGIATAALQKILYSESAQTNKDDVQESEYRRLKNGDKGDDVSKLQRRLIELGYLTGTVDGYYGDGTEAAIRAFEAAYGQKQTGIATPTLQTYIYSENAIENPNDDVAISYATLEKGDSGDAVKMLQKRLIELKYLSGKADGKFGDATMNAVKEFQKALGLKETGTANAALQKELFSEDAPVYVPIETVNKRARVTVEKTRVYSNPDGKNMIGELYKNTEITILRTSGEWAEIQNAAGEIGYAKLSDFAIIQDDPPTEDDEEEEDEPQTEEDELTGDVEYVNKIAKVNSGDVAMFKKASSNSSIVVKLKKNEKVTWLRTNGSWAEILHSNGQKGYMYKKYLTATDEPAGASMYTQLETGKTGEKVKQMQRRLKELGYFDGTIGGNYLTKTTAAVKAFQAAIGMEQTGIATVALQELMFSPAAPAEGWYKNVPMNAYPTLEYGKSNEFVGEMQLRLISFGLLNSDDCTFSKFDEATRKAVITLQERLGFTYADGAATPEIQAFLASPAAEYLNKD